MENASVEYVMVNGSEGMIQILPGHAAILGVLYTGLFAYKVPGSQETRGVISTGFFEVKDDTVMVIAQTLELRDEIDVPRAKKAQQLAEEALKDAALDEAKFKKYQLKLQRALIRQQAKD